jgi:hypothetical protein
MKLSSVAAVLCLLALPAVVATPSGAQSPDQHPLLDKLAAKVIQKYQTSSCQQLMMDKATKQAPSPQELKIIQYLKSDPQSRAIFINKVAAPIANKMFQCGMIP